VELSGINLILDLSGAGLVLEVAELSLAVFNLGSSLVLVIAWGDKSTDVLAVNRDACLFGKGLAVEVLRVDLGDVSRVARNVLGLHILGGATKPVLSVFRVVSVLELLVVFILSWGVRVEGSSGELGLADCGLNIVVGGFVPGVGDDTVDVTSSASVDIVLAGDKAGVAGKVLLVVLDGFLRHIFQLLN
jgi:hypothetical protein